MDLSTLRNSSQHYDEVIFGDEPKEAIQGKVEDLISIITPYFLKFTA